MKLITNNSKVIDIGCETGELIRNIAENKTGKFLSIDLSASMINIAKSKSSKIHNINFQVMSSLNLKLNNNTLDFALMRGAFHHFPNPQKAIKEAFRILLIDFISFYLIASK